MYDPYQLDEHFLSPVLLWINGWSELHLSAARGDVSRAQHLLDEGADLHAGNTKGRTALFEAAKRGHYEVAKLLIRRGAEVDAKENQGKTPLWESARYGHDKVVGLLVQHGAALNEQEPTQGFTGLHISSQHDHYKVVATLLARGARVNSTSHSKETPLHIAARQAWHETAAVSAILIDYKANLEARDDHGFTPLIRATSRGHLPVFSALMTRQANLNAKTFEGESALYLAAKGGHTHIAKILLAQGANPNTRCDCGSTPLHAAVRAGDPELVQLLLDQGAHINAKVRGKTALHLAEDRNRQRLVGLLKERGGKTFRILYNHVKQAREALKHRGYARAVELYTQALALDPTDAELHYLRGAALMRMKAHEKALHDLNDSLKLDPTRFDAYVKVAYVLSLHSDWGTIIVYWDKLLRLEPVNARAYYERGRVYFRKGLSDQDQDASAQAVRDTLASCTLGYQKGCQTYAKVTGRTPEL